MNNAKADSNHGCGLHSPWVLSLSCQFEIVSLSCEVSWNDLESCSGPGLFIFSFVPFSFQVLLLRTKPFGVVWGMVGVFGSRYHSQRLHGENDGLG